MLLCWFAVRPALKWLVRRADLRDGRLPGNLLGVLLAVIFMAAMATHAIGIFAIFGGFMMGVILHDEHELVAAWKERTGQFVLVFFLPIFFTYTGLRTNIGGLDSLALWGWCGLVLLLATVGKFGGAYIGARWSGLGHDEAKRARHPDEHPGPDGTHHHQRRTRPRRDLAATCSRCSSSWRSSARSSRPRASTAGCRGRGSVRLRARRATSLSSMLRRHRAPPEGVLRSAPDLQFVSLAAHQLSRHEQRQAQQEAEEQPRVHPGQQRVVAHVAEVRDAAFLGAEIPDGRRQIDRLDAASSTGARPLPGRNRSGA